MSVLSGQTKSAFLQGDERMFVYNYTFLFTIVLFLLSPHHLNTILFYVM